MITHPGSVLIELSPPVLPLLSLDDNKPLDPRLSSSVRVSPPQPFHFGPVSPSLSRSTAVLRLSRSFRTIHGTEAYIYKYYNDKRQGKKYLDQCHEDYLLVWNVNSELLYWRIFLMNRERYEYADEWKTMNSVYGEGETRRENIKLGRVWGLYEQHTLSG